MRKKISIRLIGQVPLPIGGVTIHNIRLFNWLKTCDGVDVLFSKINNSTHIDDSMAKINLIWLLKSMFRGFKEDIVHYQGANFWGVFFIVIVNRIHSRKKIVWSIHSEYLIPKLSTSLIKVFFIKLVDNIIVDNDNIKTQVVNLGVLNEKVKTLSPFLMPVDYDDIHKDVYRDIDRTKYKVAVFNAYKLVFNDNGADVYGLDTLISAFPFCDNTVVLMLLIPSMNVSERKYYDELINSLEISVKERIHLINSPQWAGWEYIQASDIFVRPTITDGDALSIRESLFMNVPTIVSDCTLRPQGVISFKTGDCKDLADKINQAINLNINHISNDINKLINNFFSHYKSILDRS